VLDSRGEPEAASNDIEEDDFPLLRIVAAGRLTASGPLPASLGGTPAPAAPRGARVRRFTLSGSEINDRNMAMTRIDEVVPAGALVVPGSHHHD